MGRSQYECRGRLKVRSTHTHSAPDCYAFPDGKGGHTGDLAYMDLVCTRAAEAVNEALDRLAPARLKVATGEARGKIAYNYYAPDLYDRRASVIQAVGADGKTASRPVKIGNSQNGQWVVLDGLKAGEQVVVDGFQKIRPNAPVKPVPWQPGGARPAPAPASAPAPAASAAK